MNTNAQAVPDESYTVCGTILRYEVLHPNGALALTLRGDNGEQLEVLSDADSTLQQLVSTFGSAPASVGNRVEIALDLFGFPVLRAVLPATPSEPSD